MTTTLLFLSLLVIASSQQTEPQVSGLLSESQKWGYGFLAGFGVSLLGFITALTVVLCKNIASDFCFEVTIKTLFSLAFGALLADIMLHILPQAYTNQQCDARIIAIIFIGAVLFFLTLERIFHALGIVHSHWHDEKCHDDHQGAIKNHDHPNKIHSQQPPKCQHDHDHNPNLSDSRRKKQRQYAHSHPISNIHQQNEELVESKKNIESNSKENQSNNFIEQTNMESNQELDQEKRSCLQNLKGKGSAGYMNLMGSLIHNFIDGLAVGFAFATGDSSKYVTVLIVIIAHQIPRQMGDVAILMTSKFSSTQTVLCNGFINFIALIGVLIGLGVTTASQATQTYIMVFVAGNFMYIAADIWRNLFKNSSKCKNAFQFIGAAVGIGCMYVVLIVEQM